MRLFGLNISLARKAEAISLDTLIRRLEAVHQTAAAVQVTPDNAMESPTVHAIVTAVSRRIASLPVHVLQKTMQDGRERKEPLPNHPVARLLNRPNDWESRVSYWLDAASWLVRYGNYYAFKARGQTGPIRRLVPLHPGRVTVKQQDDLSLAYEVISEGGQQNLYRAEQIHHARGPARNGFKGDSPITDVREAIALEIAAERMGASVFGNGAMPGLVFKFMEGSQGFRTEEERKKFVEEFEAAYGRRGRFRALLMPKGIELGQQLTVENEKAQFLETRKLQRSVIAGAFGIPPHMVGDLERATFSNIEEQSLEFVQQVILPYARIFEAAMEGDLLSDADRRGGIVIRFNLDAALRGDFKSRQEGLKIQREAGVISPNDWRERENMNPISVADGGEEFWRQGPSGQSGKTDQGGSTSDVGSPAGG